MFVRKNKNRSGTYSIQIIQKIQGKTKVVKTIGSSSIPQQLEQMESLAWSEINKIKGLGSLFISESDSLIKNTISAISNQQIQVLLPEANYMETIPLKPDQEQALLKEIVS